MSLLLKSVKRIKIFSASKHFCFLKSTFVVDGILFVLWSNFCVYYFLAGNFMFKNLT